MVYTFYCKPTFRTSKIIILKKQPSFILFSPNYLAIKHQTIKIHVLSIHTKNGIFAPSLKYIQFLKKKVLL